MQMPSSITMRLIKIDYHLPVWRQGNSANLVTIRLIDKCHSYGGIITYASPQLSRDIRSANIILVTLWMLLSLYSFYVYSDMSVESEGDAYASQLADHFVSSVWGQAMVDQFIDLTKSATIR